MAKKHGIKNTAKASKKPAASLAEKTEHILLTMPRIIALQITKDLMVLKQQESKLKDDLQKAQSQKKKVLASMSLLKKKNTPAARKQSKLQQKKLQKASQMVVMFSRALETLMKQAQVLMQKKAKYSALQAQLSKFQKEWAKKPSKKLTSAKKTKIKAKSMKKAARKTTEKMPAQSEANYSLFGTRVVEVIELPDERETATDKVS